VQHSAVGGERLGNNAYEEEIYYYIYYYARRVAQIPEQRLNLSRS
jgi:hypothetical protein